MGAAPKGFRQHGVGHFSPPLHKWAQKGVPNTGFLSHLLGSYNIQLSSREGYSNFVQSVFQITVVGSAVLAITAIEGHHQFMISMFASLAILHRVHITVILSRLFTISKLKFVRGIWFGPVFLCFP